MADQPLRSTLGLSNKKRLPTVLSPLKEAREIRCVCACGGKNHGVANRAGMPKLDELLELDGVEIEFLIEPPTPDELAT